LKKIVLVCSAGMSTSLLVVKMKEAAKKQGEEVEIIAVPEVEAKQHIKGTDLVLLAPQVRYLLNKMKQDLDPLGIPVAVIDGLLYGMFNGEGVMKQAMALISNK